MLQCRKIFPLHGKRHSVDANFLNCVIGFPKFDLFNLLSKLNDLYLKFIQILLFGTVLQGPRAIPLRAVKPEGLHIPRKDRNSIPHSSFQSCNKWLELQISSHALTLEKIKVQNFQRGQYPSHFKVQCFDI